MRPSRLFMFGGLVLATGFLSAACASKAPERDVASITGSQAPGAAASGAPDQEAFVRCMEENGGTVGRVEGPNNGQPNGQVSGAPQSDGEPAKQQQALEKCRQFLPDGGAPQRMSPEQLEQARNLAKCMREAGVDYPDPDPATAGAPGAMAVPPGVDINNPDVRAKFDACLRKVTRAGTSAVAR
jgi:hypothetical protein